MGLGWTGSEGWWVPYTAVCRTTAIPAPCTLPPFAAYISTVNHHEGMYRQLCAALDAAEADMRAQGQGRHGQGEEEQARGGGADGGQGSSLPCPPGPAPLPPGWDREALLVGQKLRMDMEQVRVKVCIRVCVCEGLKVY